MNLLDDLYFWLLDKILRFSMRICSWVDEVTGLDRKVREEEDDEH